jgi:hypothetical protein
MSIIDNYFHPEIWLPNVIEIFYFLNEQCLPLEKIFLLFNCFLPEDFVGSGNLLCHCRWGVGTPSAQIQAKLPAHGP